MKKILFTLFAFSASGTASSQVLFTENFDGSASLPVGWGQYNVDGLTPFPGAVTFGAGDGWVINPNNVSGIGNHAISTSFYNPAGQANDWLISPAISIPSGDPYVLQFDAKASDSFYPDGFKVYVSTTGNQVSDFTSPPILVVPEATAEYANYTAGLASFSGQTIYFAIQNDSYNKLLLYIDNVQIRQPLANDAMLETVLLNRYSLINTDNTLNLLVKNNGGDVITSLDVDWNDGTSHSQTISGLNIAPGITDTVSHPIPVNYAAVIDQTINVAITAVNGATDSTANNTTNVLFNTVSEASQKRVVFEEGTGTWCGFCVRGIVAIEYMDSLYPNTFIGIAVHNGDPMTVAEYNSNMNLPGYPSCNVDRKLLAKGVSSPQFQNYYNSLINQTVPADINAVSSGSGNELTVDVTATFKSVFTTANFRLAVVLTEDNVTGTTSDYDQHNYYAGGGIGPMGGFELLPDPVPAAQMVYDHVGRALLGGFDGVMNSVPATITDGQVVNYSFNYTIPDSVMNRGNMHAVALLIDATNGEIINAKEISIATVGVSEKEHLQMSLFPNPSVDVVNVQFEGQGGEYLVTLHDLSGRLLIQTQVTSADGSTLIPLSTAHLPAGNYLVSVSNTTSSTTQHISVK